MEPRTQHAWTTDVATATATGLVTALFPTHRWSHRAQRRLHGGFGALAAVATGAGVWRHRRDDEAVRPSPATLAAVAVGTGLVTAAVSRGGQGADAWVERRLATRGVRRPRAWIGAAAAGASLAMSAVERRRARAAAPA